MRDHRLPLIAALIFGLAYVFVTPPFRVPDEVLHFWRADAIAMGHFLPNGGGKPDSAHIPQGLKTLVWVMSWVEVKVTRPQFRTAYEIPLEPVKEPLVQFPAWYTPVPYIPQAITAAVARLLNVRPLIIFYAGRVANVVAALAMIGISLRLASAFRTVIAAVALLPMTLFEFASWSADAMTIAASILFITLLRSREDAALLGTTGIIVGLCKPAYFLTALLARRRVIVLVVLCVFVATVAAFAYAHLAAYQQRTDLPIDPASQLRCVTSDPFHFLGVITKDLRRHCWWYLEGTIAHLGLSEVTLPLVITWLELLMLVWVGISNGLAIDVRTRVLMIAIFIVTSIGVMLSQYLIWSAICGDAIEGVQGRYFLPVLPLALLSMRIPAVRRAPPMALVVAVAAVANTIALFALVRRYWW